jgi:Na+/H+-dicarboxylate symporter
MAGGILTGVLLGPTTGWLPSETATELGDWLALPGGVFLGLIQMIVVPLVFASVIRGLAASESLEYLRRMGLAAIVFFVLTTALAIVVGILLALWVRPGTFVDAEDARRALGTTQAAPTEVAAPMPESVPEAIVGVMPRNPLGSIVEAEMLQIVFFAVVVGMALVSLSPAHSRPILELLGSVQEVTMAVVRYAMRLAPIAVFGLMAQLTTKLGLDALLGMSVYVATVLFGLVLLLVVYIVIIVAFTRLKPWSYLSAVREVQLLAFSTSSSAAVMPLSIKTAEEKLGIRPSVAQFVIPLGATINMNGTALYQGVATMFLAQVFGVELSTSALVLVVVTAVAASIGSPATPGVGIVILSMVLTAAGVPAAGIGLIIGVDRIIDMTRTAVNVTGDLVAAAVLDRTIGGELSAQEQLQREEEREKKRSRRAKRSVLGWGPKGGMRRV